MILASLAACVDFGDATGPVKVRVQLLRPEIFVNMSDMAGLEGTLSGGGQSLTAVTDHSGCALFDDLAPGTYDIAVSTDISSKQYEQLSGQAAGRGIGFVMAGGLNRHAIMQETTVEVGLTVLPKETLVIGKIYSSTSKIEGGTFSIGKYIEIFNNSGDSVDAAGLYIALLESESSIAYKVYPYDEAQMSGYLCVKQIFRIPDDRTVMVAPGGSLLIVNSAVDHTSQNAYERDLRGADFEAKDANNKIPNNPGVPALELVYTTYSSISCMNLVQGGPTGVVIFRSDEKVAEWNTVYAFGKTKGNMFIQVPTGVVMDGVDIIKNKAQTGADINSKRLPQDIDGGYTTVTSASGTVAAITAEGRVILQDTNNSLNDFICNDTISPRYYLHP